MNTHTDAVAPIRRRLWFSRLSDIAYPTRRWLALLVLIEFAALIAALYAAVQLRFLGRDDQIVWSFGAVLPRALLFAGVMSITMAALGLYQSHSRERLRGQLGRIVVAFAVGGVALVASFYLFPAAYIGRGVAALALGFGLGGVLALRYVFTGVVDQAAFRRRVLVLGAGRKASLILSRMRRAADRRNFQIMGFVPLPGDDLTAPAELRRDPSLIGGLEKLARQLDIDEIVVGPDDRRGHLPLRELLQLRTAGIKVIDLPQFFEREAGKIKLGLIDPSSLIFAQGFDTRAVRRGSKRAFDVAASCLLLLLASPLMLFTMLAIRLESGRGAPILYRQDRVGEGGRDFAVLKFRSMRTDAEQNGVAQWAKSNDDRVTRVGRIIRKLRIDELPQIFNVLRGEMSFVGPRPERPQFVRELERQIPYYAIRHQVKPGITGWAQLRYPYGASTEDAAEKLKYDLYYVKHHSLAFDAMILLQTVEVVLFGKGAR